MKGHKKDGVPCAYKHGYDYSSPTYRSWKMMRVRCNNKTVPGAHNYAGRGIRHCEEWNDFRNFLADMGERPDGTSLERLDNDGPYCKENCIWLSIPLQQKNTRRTRRVKIAEVEMTFRDACRLYGRDESTIRKILKRLPHLTVEAALLRDDGRKAS